MRDHKSEKFDGTELEPEDGGRSGMAESGYRECRFHACGLTFHAKRWGSQGGRPVLALHGWLDNAASFDFVAPLLNGVDLIALDLAGQGLSGHRPHAGAYNIWLDVMEIIAIADQLNWKQFGLLGHSRGAMIATLIAGTFPERVSHLALIESFTPQTVDAAQAPEQLASAIRALKLLGGRERTEFATFEAAVKARENGFVPLAYADALALATRGVKQIGGKFFWNNDIRLNAPSEVKFTEEQVCAFVDRIAIPIELILADDGIVQDFPHAMELIETKENLRVHQLEGEHHLHMSQQCQQIAGILHDYFAS